MTIHIFTGAAGGIGKTLFALIAAVLYQDDERFVVVFDRNTMNPDVARIIPASNFRQFRKYNHDQLQGWEPTRNVRIVTSTEPATMIDAVRFWTDVRYVVSDFSRRIPNTMLLIDTNVNPAGLWNRRGSNPRQIYQILDEIADFNIHHVYVWFLWTFAAINDTPGFTGGDPTRHIARAITHLNNPRFRHDEHVNRDWSVEILHVLSPYGLVPMETDADEQTKEERRNRFEAFVARLREDRRRQDGSEDDDMFSREMPIEGPFTDLADALPAAGHLEFDVVHECLRNAIAGGDVGDPIAIYNAIAEEIFNVMLSREGLRRRPLNVFPVPVFCPELLRYIERLIHAKHQINWNDVGDQLSCVSRYVKKYLMEIDLRG
ncbi:MAG: hypothetical protein K8S97_11135 [Anaerolineae bacterium]|nr:hypothetical protein [Anaerolineae bacterium]